MKKGNRNFCQEVKVDKGDGYSKYDRLDINIFNADNCGNLKLQDLDLYFSKELSENPSRFKIIKSYPRKKKVIFNCCWLAIVTAFLFVASILVSNYAKDLILLVFGNDSNAQISDYDLNASVSVLKYVMSEFQLFLNMFAIFLLFLFLIGFLARRPFVKFNNGKKFVLILDKVGFYKIDIDISRVQENNLDDLYFVQFVENYLNKSLKNCVSSVSYFSNYLKTMSDSKYYVLDLPNDTITFSNAYDLEFCRKDFKSGDFKKLVTYLDDSEDGYEE